MASAARTDVHRPSLANPADYVYVGEADSHVTEGWVDFDWKRFAELTGDAAARERHPSDLGEVRWEQVSHTGWQIQGDSGIEAGQCDHCGHQAVRRWVFFLHKPTSKVVAVGGLCADRLWTDSREQADERAAAKARRENARSEARLVTWLARGPRHVEVRDFLAAHSENGKPNSFYDSLFAQLRRDGELSGRQVDAALKAKARDEERGKERAEQEADEPAPAPVVEGRIECVGKVLHTRSQASRYGYGSESKMLFLDDRGFKLWGTAPAKLYSDSEGEVKGARLRFFAEVSASPGDETFGFFRRPTKVVVLDTGEEDDG